MFTVAVCFYNGTLFALFSSVGSTCIWPGLPYCNTMRLNVVCFSGLCIGDNFHVSVNFLALCAVLQSVISVYYIDLMAKLLA